MVHRVEVKLEDQLFERLRIKTTEGKISIAELVREALADYFNPKAIPEPIVESYKDTALFRLDQKKRQLERTIESYKKVLDDLAVQYEALNIKEQEQEVLANLREMHKEFSDLQGLIQYNKAVKGLLAVETLEGKLENLLEYARKAMGYINDFETFREKTFKTKTTEGKGVRV